jgi:hypothetical protein
MNKFFNELFKFSSTTSLEKIKVEFDLALNEKTEKYKI